MSASDAAPLPRLGEVFFDVRGDSRTMRLSWYADTGIAVFSVWHGGTCTGTFRLPIADLPRMVAALRSGPEGDPLREEEGRAGRAARPEVLPRPLDAPVEDVETGQTAIARRADALGADPAGDYPQRDGRRRADPLPDQPTSLYPGTDQPTSLYPGPAPRRDAAPGRDRLRDEDPFGEGDPFEEGGARLREPAPFGEDDQGGYRDGPAGGERRAQRRGDSRSRTRRGEGPAGGPGPAGGFGDRPRRGEDPARGEFPDREFAEGEFPERDFGNRDFPEGGFRGRGFPEGGSQDRGFPVRSLPEREFAERGFPESDVRERGFVERDSHSREITGRESADRDFTDGDFRDPRHLEAEFWAEQFEDEEFQDKALRRNQRRGERLDEEMRGGPPGRGGYRDAGPDRDDFRRSDHAVGSMDPHSRDRRPRRGDFPGGSRGADLPPDPLAPGRRHPRGSDQWGGRDASVDEPAGGFPDPRHLGPRRDDESLVRPYVSAAAEPEDGPKSWNGEHPPARQPRQNEPPPDSFPYGPPPGGSSPPEGGRRPRGD